MPEERHQFDDLQIAFIVNLVGDLAVGMPNPDDTGPPGPWDPLVAGALNWWSPPDPWARGPVPDPWAWRGLAGLPVDDMGFGSWRGPPKPNWLLAMIAGLAGHFVDDLGGAREPRPNWLLRAMLSALNPQPLPPGPPDRLRVVRTLASHLLAEAGRAAGDGGPAMVARFIDDWCGTPPRVPLWPFPWPPPPWWSRTPTPLDSLVLGAALSRAAGRLDEGELRHAAQRGAQQALRHGMAGMG